MNRTVHAKSGHTLHISTIDRSELPANVCAANVSDLLKFDTFYEVRNWDKGGVVFMYLGKGHPAGPKEICAWYRATGAMWSGYGKTLVAAVNGAQRDGWMYA
jgi:hypothetical protein